MNKQFVTKDIAFKLKALGFNEPCMGFFKFNNDKLFYDSTIIRFRNNEDLNFFSDITTRASAPLWSQVIDWFRTTYGLHITSTGDNDKSRFKYDGYVFEINRVDWSGLEPDEDNLVYTTIMLDYEIAREEVINFALEIVTSTMN